jgi:ribonuclease Z
MAEKIKITFLGTSGAIPTANRNHTSILLNYKKDNILIDCGEGTQRQFTKAKLSFMNLSKILITHWHGDHILGIPGLLQTLAFNDYKKTLFIYGPEKSKKFISKILDTFIFSGKINIKTQEISKGKFFENEDFYIKAKRVYHGVPCNAYYFLEKGKVRIDKNKLKKFGIKEGAFLFNLKKGKDLFYEGKKYKFEDLTYKEEDKKISFIFDTRFDKSIINFVKNSDLLICESSFSSENKELSKKYYHLTSKQAAEIAKKANVKRIILTHISQRYNKNIEIILEEAKEIFKNVSIAKDLDVIYV